jgi:hypothetical protein
MHQSVYGPDHTLSSPLVNVCMIVHYLMDPIWSILVAVFWLTDDGLSSTDYILCTSLIVTRGQFDIHHEGYGWICGILATLTLSLIDAVIHFTSNNIE